MPYADPDKQREFQRKRLAAIRAKWLAENGPCVKCGTRDDLQVDHVDPSDKVTHSVWSWSKERRDAELAKCQVLCRRCHKTKSLENGDLGSPGESNPNSILTAEEVLEIRRIYKKYDPEFGGAALGRRFGVTKYAISDIVLRKKWKHI